MLIPVGLKVWLVAGATDMRRGFDGLALIVQTQLSEDPFGGHVFVFRGKRGDRIKLLWWDGSGLCLLCKRLEEHYFAWPTDTAGAISLSRAQLSLLLEGLDWRRRMEIPRPYVAV